MKNLITLLLLFVFSPILFAQSKFQALQVAYKFEIQDAHLSLPTELDKSIERTSYQGFTNFVDLSYMFEIHPKVAIQVGSDFGYKNLYDHAWFDFGGEWSFFSWGPSPTYPVHRITSSNLRIGLHTSMTYVIGRRTLNQNHAYFEMGINYGYNFNYNYEIRFKSPHLYEESIEKAFTSYLNGHSHENQLSLQLGAGWVFRLSHSLRANINFIKIQKTISDKSAIVIDDIFNHETSIGLQYQLK